MATIIPIQMADGERSPGFRRIAFYGGELLVVGLLELGLDPCRCRTVGEDPTLDTDDPGWGPQDN